MKKTLIILLIVIQTGFAFSQDFGNEMFSLSQIKKGLKSKRVSSYDHSGGNHDFISGIKDGTKTTIMNVKGAGVISRIWITLLASGSEEISRNDIIIRMYWDGNSFPSVESPIGPFFGNGWNESYTVVSAPLSVAPAGPKAYVSYFAMPFSNGARIEFENQSGKEISHFFYNIDYVEVKKLPHTTGRFHAWYNHEVTVPIPGGEDDRGTVGELEKNKSGKANYIFADIKGKGQFVGVNYYINCPITDWYGEGDEMIFIDGEPIPSIIGTGTEDFFNTSFCPRELFQHPYFGSPRVNNQYGFLGRTHVYRFLLQDPVYYDKSCKFTIEHGDNNNLTLDLASVAYWYQEKASALREPPSKEERQPKPVIGEKETDLWQKIWKIDKEIKSIMNDNER
ncbi:MAG: DUF2961 domain-containing protein [Mariniphaga sp.]|nr:DUF2961 domain-containing protein [Mariniphaga sp.]